MAPIRRAQILQMHVAGVSLRATRSKKIPKCDERHIDFARAGSFYLVNKNVFVGAFAIPRPQDFPAIHGALREPVAQHRQGKDS
jgi:hypothetical protein